MNHLYILYTSAASSRELESMAASSCNDYTQWEQFLDALLEKSPRLSWPQEMKLLYALEHEDIDLAGKILAETEDLRPVSEDLVADIVAFALERNLAVALDAAAKSGQDNLLDTVLRQVEMLTPSQLKSQLPPLLSLLPEEPRLQILNAFYLLPPSHGLDLLLGLDGKGYVPENPQEFFKIITCMLHQVENLPGEPPWTSTLDDIVMTYILNNHHVLLRLADYVEAFYSESDASMLRAIANHGKPVPKVIWQRPKVYPTGLRLSPDGKWLICNFKLSTGSEIVIVNLDTGKETTIKSPYHIGSWYWSPDSSRAAASFLKGQDSIALIISTARKTQKPRELSLPENTYLEGWLDNDHLAIQAYYSYELGKYKKVASLNANSGKITWLREYRNMLTINHAGELVWIDRQSDSFVFIKGTKKESIPANNISGSMSYLGWFPDDRKYMIIHQGSTVILDLDTKKINFGPALNLSHLFCWADTNSIWNSFTLDFLGLASPLVKTNLITGETVFSGVILPFCAFSRTSSAGNLVAVACEGEYGIKVFRMP